MNPFYFCAIGFNVLAFISSCIYEPGFVFFFFFANPAKSISFIFDMESLSLFNIQSNLDGLGTQISSFSFFHLSLSIGFPSRILVFFFFFSKIYLRHGGSGLSTKLYPTLGEPHGL